MSLVLTDLKSALAGPFDLTVPAGQCLAVTGPSGAGKSLFLRMIADLDPHEGSVSLNGEAATDISAPDWRRRCLYVGPDSGWWGESVIEHFAVSERSDARVLADRFGLKPELLDGLVARLSTGEKQRLALIRALVRNSPCLLLDEPTGALDAESVVRVEVELRARLDKGLILILVTHDPAQAQRLGDVHQRLEGGRLRS